MPTNTNLIIKEGTIGIAGSAFLNCSELTSITMPNSLKYIGDGTFAKCSNLTSVTIGNSVTSIGSYAFWDCSELISVIIPNSVTSIGENVFYNCSNLTSITLLMKNPPIIEGNPFGVNATLHVLAGCKAIYEASPFWKDYTIVEDATNGIGIVEGTPTISSNKIFSISGQQLNKTQKGVNIINGKKILVK